MLDNKKNLKLALAGAGILIAAIFTYLFLFGAPEKRVSTEEFIVNLNTADNQAVIKNLKSKGFIKHSWALNFVFGFRNEQKIQPGGYEISKSMSPWKIAEILSQKPHLVWVIIPEGLRKEEISDILAKDLGWSADAKQKWITDYTAMKYDYFEGVYFPDTYLIPVDEQPLDVATRLQAKFQEEFAPYAAQALKQNIKWDTALKIASIIQREAGGKTDMPIIAGVLWNRLTIGMKLGIDATIQYARGNTGNGWWAPISVADKKIDSPYNTYLYAGLPPHPICNPGIEAIAAVLSPAKTDCLYYLHDSSRVIHCAKTYEEHLANIQKYLK